MSQLLKLCLTAKINHVFLSFSAVQTHDLLNIHLKTLLLWWFFAVMDIDVFYLSTCRRYHYYWILTDCVYFRVDGVLFKCRWSLKDWWFSCDVESHRRNYELWIINITVLYRALCTTRTRLDGSSMYVFSFLMRLCFLLNCPR